jgi:hypothetical protein
MRTFEELREYLAEINIAHHIQGRIRLKIHSYPKDLPESWHNPITLQAIIERASGIRSVRVNPMARSCAVEYDPAVIPFQAWHDFLAGTDSHAARILEGILHSTYQEITHAKL